MAKPASLPRWGETAAGVVGPVEVEPNEGKKDIGWEDGGDIPTAGGLNWWMRLVYLWAKFLDTATSVAAAGAIVVRDAAGRAAVVDPSAAGDIDTKGARDSAITTHNGVTNPHSATAAATASRIVLRDAAGRAAFADPSAAGDAATKGYVDGKFTADTGITAGTGWTLSNVSVQLSGSIVSFAFTASAGAGAAWSNIATLSVGFRPTVTRPSAACRLYDGSVPSYHQGMVRAQSNGVVSLDGNQAQDTGSALGVPFTLASGDQMEVVYTFPI